MNATHPSANSAIAAAASTAACILPVAKHLVHGLTPRCRFRSRGTGGSPPRAGRFVRLRFRRRPTETDERNEQKAGHVHRLVEAGQPAPKVRHVDPELADQLVLRGVVRVNEIVVVALEHVVRAIPADNPVDHRADLRVPVRHHVARFVRTGLAHDGKGRRRIPGLQALFPFTIT